MTSPSAAADLWSWVDDDNADQLMNPIDHRSVVAVMVTHNAEDWLGRQLRSLASLDPRPGRIVVVDNGSTDSTRHRLDEAKGSGIVDTLIPGDATWGFGRAVAAALGGGEEWIWLLHDDSAPHPDALEQLLRGAALQGADVVYPKLLQPKRRNYPETLSEIGQTIARSGLRVGTVEDGDIDQGQDQPREVLGGSTAGLLIRGAAWRHLGGLAPQLPLHRDGVDLGWRANETGMRVITWPEAILTHRQAGMTGQRVSALEPDPHEGDRMAALRVVAARGPRPRNTTSLRAESWLRALGFLLLKSPRLAKAELRAARRFTEASAVADLRKGTPDNPRDVAALLPVKFWALRAALDRLGSGIAERYRDFASQDESELSIDDMTGDDFSGGMARRRVFTPLAMLTLTLIVVAVVAARTLLGTGSIFGGGLLPAPRDFAAAWHQAITPDVGVAGAAAPWQLVGALLSWVTFGNPQTLVLLALTLAPVLAALSAHFFLRRLALGQATSAVLAATWAGATLLLGLVTAGDIGGMALAIILPNLARTIVKVAQDDSPGAERLRAPAAAAFWLLLGAIAWPLLWFLVLLGGVGWVVRQRYRWPEVVVILVVPAAFLAPWTPAFLAAPGRLLTGPDPLAWPAFPQASLAMFAGRILPSGFPAWGNIAFFVVLGLAAAYATFRLSSTRRRILVFALVGVPLVAGALLSRIAVPVAGGEARALLSAWALLTVAALLTPIGLLRRGEGAPALDRRIVLTSLTAVAMLAFGLWAFFGFSGPVDNRPSALPGFAQDVIASQRQSRALMIENHDDGRLTWNVVDATQPRWGTGERNPAGAFKDSYAELVQFFSGGDAPEDLADRLTAVGIGHVWTRGFSAEQVAAIGNAAGLTSNPSDDVTVVWTVVGLPSRVMVVGEEGATPIVAGEIEAADTPRHLRLAEVDDGRWQVTVGGTRLARVAGDSGVTFVLPAGVFGAVNWGLSPSNGVLAWQVIVIVLLIGLAAPTAGGGSSARRGMED